MKNINQEDQKVKGKIGSDTVIAESLEEMVDMTIIKIKLIQSIDHTITDAKARRRIEAALAQLRREVCK